MNAPLGAAPERIWLAVEAVDMRLGIDGLSARIQASLGRTPCDGTAYAFTNRRRSRLKLLVWDGTMALADRRRRLATPGRARTRPLAGLGMRRLFRKARRIHDFDVFSSILMV